MQERVRSLDEFIGVLERFMEQLGEKRLDQAVEYFDQMPFEASKLRWEQDRFIVGHLFRFILGRSHYDNKMLTDVIDENLAMPLQNFFVWGILLVRHSSKAMQQSWELLAHHGIDETADEANEVPINEIIAECAEAIQLRKRSLRLIRREDD